MAADGLVTDAVPAQAFARGPYRAELFDAQSQWAGVMNANGVNCLTFKSQPGAVVTDFETAKAIANRWNRG